MNQKGKVILITGASSGIGYETAMILAAEGHKVYGAARRTERMEPLKEYGIVPIFMDMTDDGSMQAAVAYVMDTEGRIDVLVNNAGYGSLGAIENVPIDEAKRQLEVNVFGLARLTQLVLPHMRGQGSGTIINSSSIAGKSVFYMTGWYNVSKYAVEAFSDALRIETKPFGIDVVIIEPGGIRTDWGAIAADHLAESSKGTVYEEVARNEADSLRKAYSMKILPRPSVIAKTICRAVKARRPKTRYRAGAGSGAIIFLHGLLPTRWWDALVRLGGKRLLSP